MFLCPCADDHLVFAIFKKYFRIPEILDFLIFRSIDNPALPFPRNSVPAFRHDLVFPHILRFFPLSDMSCKEQPHFLLIINQRSPRKRSSHKFRMIQNLLLRLHAHREVYPVNQILADCMSPVHIVPLFREWMKLVKQMIVSVIKAKAVRIIHPSLQW